MLYEIVSTQSWNVLGTFDDESVARKAIQLSVTARGASVGDLVVYLSDESGRVGELTDGGLASWADIDKPNEFVLPARPSGDPTN